MVAVDKISVWLLTAYRHLPYDHGCREANVEDGNHDNLDHSASTEARSGDGEPFPHQYQQYQEYRLT